MKVDAKKVALTLLITSAIVLNSWTAVAIVLLACVKEGFDRIYPEKKPDPTGAELLAALELHKEIVERELNSMHAKINLKTNQRMLRE